MLSFLRIIEDWKKALDDNKFIAAILMDLSKAFDCFPNNLLMLKLEAYGLSENSLKLIKSYLENRRQRWKTSLLSLCYHFLEF
jgi:lipoate-protein ligase A